MRLSAFANCGRAVAHVRGSYVPISDIADYSMISSAAAEKAIGTSMPQRPGGLEVEDELKRIQANGMEHCIVDRRKTSAAVEHHCSPALPAALKEYVAEGKPMVVDEISSGHPALCHLIARRIAN
jgi:hypothetical protein